MTEVVRQCAASAKLRARGGPPFRSGALMFQTTDRCGWIGFPCRWVGRDPLPVPRTAGRDCR